jgi:hypothetical protein
VEVARTRSATTAVVKSLLAQHTRRAQSSWLNMHVPDLIWDSTESMGRFGCVSVSICLWLLKRWQCPVRASLVAPSRCPLTRPKTIGALITYEDLTSESWRHGCDRHYWVAVPRDLHPLRPNSKTAPCRAVAGTCKGVQVQIYAPPPSPPPTPPAAPSSPPPVHVDSHVPWGIAPLTDW